MDPPGDELTLRPDPMWPERYEAERARVVDAAERGLLGIFHVGSTAIPDVPGKPALDVMPVFEEYGSMRATAETLTEGEYALEHDAPDCVVLRRAEDHSVLVRMHSHDAEQWRPMLVFCEYLRDDVRRERSTRGSSAGPRPSIPTT